MDYSPTFGMAKTLARSLERNGESKSMKDDGGKALEPCRWQSDYKGPTIRQYYKAAALYSIRLAGTYTDIAGGTLTQDAAKAAAALADAMIAEDRAHAERDDEYR